MDIYSFIIGFTVGFFISLIFSFLLSIWYMKRTFTKRQKILENLLNKLEEIRNAK